MNPEDKSIHLWIKKHNIKTETGVPLDFKDHLFMYDIYSDFSPNLVCLKAAQITFSTMEILKTFWQAKHWGVDIIYTLPSSNDVKDFVGAKVNRIIDNNPILQEYVKDRDTIEQKRVGEQVVYFRGTWTSREAIAVSADIVKADEVDRSDQKVVEQYESRLQHSKFGHRSYFSNPSYEGNGVSKYWEKSDKRHWFITCSKCKGEHYMNWPESVDMAKREYICKLCKASLSREDRRVGRWKRMKTPYVPRYRGYWINLMMAPWVDCEDVITQYEEKDEEYFYNFVLGLPYVGSGNKVEESTIRKNIEDKANSMEGQIMIGVDTGLGIHLVVGNHAGLFYWNTSENYDEFERLMTRFKDAVAVFDAQGDLQKPRELQEKYPGRIWLCYYRQDRKTNQLIKWGEKKERGVVQADRNRLIQFVVDEFRGGRIKIYGKSEDWDEFVKHWKNIYRSEEETSLGVMKRVWKRSGADHLCHAVCYWRIGLDRFTGAKGSMIMPDETIFIPTAPTIGYDGTVPLKDLVMPAKEEDWRDV